jgi:hypothetical protein
MQPVRDHDRGQQIEFRRRRGSRSNFTRTLASMLLLAEFGGTALAQMTREQVKAELADAIRTGDMLANGESGLTLYEMFPERYAKARPAMYARKPTATTAAASAALEH